MLAVVSHNNAQQPFKIVRTLHRQLFILQLYLEVMVARLHSLLRPEAHASHLPLGPQELFHMRLKQVNLNSNLLDQNYVQFNSF